MVLSRRLKWIEDFEDAEDIIEYFKPNFYKVNKHLIEQKGVNKGYLKSFDDLLCSGIYERIIVEAVLDSVNEEYWFYYDEYSDVYVIYEVV